MSWIAKWKRWVVSFRCHGRHYFIGDFADEVELAYPPTLILADLQNWRISRDGLATSLDDIMARELFRILGAAPWQPGWEELDEVPHQLN